MGDSFFKLTNFNLMKINGNHYQEIYRTQRQRIYKPTKEESGRSESSRCDAFPEGSLDVPNILIAHNIPFNGKEGIHTDDLQSSKCPLSGKTHTKPVPARDIRHHPGGGRNSDYFCFIPLQNKTLGRCPDKIFRKLNL